VLAKRLEKAAFRRKILGELLKRCQALSCRRETTVFRFQWLWPLLRSAVLELGQRLKEKGVLTDAADVFFLRKDELIDAEHRLARGDSWTFDTEIQERRAVWDHQRTLLPPDRVPQVDDPVWSKKGPAPWGNRPNIPALVKEELKGLSASTGYAKGPARLIYSSTDFDRLQKGDILVTVTTSPAWTPLFGLAAAVVTECGGVTSHASVVAREYGIPAVVGTGCATKIIQDGQWIEVDGQRGVVLLSNSPTS
ncbi:MAG: hypothetical protein JW862_13720, partial [Anaerolineales bacterium]|nr:hypothetical protein [Anaerolineales bacterium]